MDFSRNLRQRPNFRQPNASLPREHENVPLTSPVPMANQSRPPLVGKKDSNFLIAPYQMDRIKKSLETVYFIRKAESDWQNCLRCGLITRKKCGGCSRAPYCCEECQNNDWERHSQECGNDVESQNIASQIPRHFQEHASFVENQNTSRLNAELFQSHQGVRNNFLIQQQNFDYHVPSTQTDQGDKRHHRNSESGQFNKNQSRDDINQVVNGCHRDFDQAQNKNKCPLGGRFPQDSNKSEDSQSYNAVNNADKGLGEPKKDQINPNFNENQNKRSIGGGRSPSNRNEGFHPSRKSNNPEENWDDSELKKDKMNQDLKKGGSPGKSNQRREDNNKRKSPGGNNFNLGNANKNVSEEDEWGNPRNTETSNERDKPKNFERNINNDKIKKEPVSGRSSCEPKNLINQEQTSGSSSHKEVKAKKSENLGIRTVIGIAPCDKSSIYVLTTTDVDSVSALSFFDELHKSLQDDAPQAKSIEPEIGLICACLCEGEWYRGKIVSIKPDIEFISLDFGPTWKCDKVDVPTRVLAQELIEGPGMARLVKFTENLPDQEFEGQTFSIEVLEEHEEYDVARYIGKIKTEEASEKESSEKESSSPIANPEKPVCKNLHLQEDQIASGSFVTIVLSVGFNVCYVQRVDFAEPKLLEIGEKINNYAKTGKPFQNEESIKVGDVVCARFLDDMCFYRALVESKDGKKINVQFIDYGNSQDKTDLIHIFPLPDELKSYPQLAVKVHLKGVTSNVKKYDGKQCIEAAEYLNNLSVDSIKLKLTFEDDILKGVILTEHATGRVVNEEINKKLSKQ